MVSAVGTGMGVAEGDRVAVEPYSVRECVAGAEALQLCRKLAS